MFSYPIKGAYMIPLSLCSSLLMFACTLYTLHCPRFWINGIFWTKSCRIDTCANCLFCTTWCAKTPLQPLHLHYSSLSLARQQPVREALGMAILCRNNVYFVWLSGFCHGQDSNDRPWPSSRNSCISWEIEAVTKSKKNCWMPNIRWALTIF